MLFPTVTFAIFFLLVLPTSWLLMPKRHRWKLFMLAASYFFYGYWNWRFCLLLGLSTIVNQAFADRFWPGQDPVGRQFRFGDATDPRVTIVGVVGTARFRDLTTDLTASTSEPDIFYSFAQLPDVDLALLVRTSGD